MTLHDRKKRDFGVVAVKVFLMCIDWLVEKDFSDWSAAPNWEKFPSWSETGDNR